ncbi:ATP-binding protein [Maridesulfovibrio sp.]|uniref:ATP-binding protein n=1 Tax=Maridesulfovibrio sp. TaxID=2795000 RepID=UPI0039F03732
MLNNKLPGFFKEQVTSKVLLLCLMFFVAFTVIYVLDRVEINSIAGYEREIQNQQDRAELGKAIMHRLLMIELGVVRMIDSTDLRKVDLIMGDINHSFNKLGNILNILQNGGTFTNTFPANFYDKDEVQEKITFQRKKGAGYVMTVIDLNPKIFELEEAINTVSFKMRELLSGDNAPDLEKVHEDLNFRTMQIDALILRARESASKIFHDTQTDIKRLNGLKAEASDNMDTLRACVFTLTIPVCLYIFFRIMFNIRTILADRENKARNLEEAKSAIETILDSIPAGMVIINEHREVVRVNSEALRIFEVDSEEMVLGHRCDKIFCLSVSDGCPFAGGLEDNLVNEVKIKTSSGCNITVLKNATYITLSGERVILEAFMDISQRIEMEKRLQEQQDYANAVLQGVQAGVVVISASTHTIVDMNETAAKLIGVNREQALGAVCHKYICPAEVGKCPVTDLGHEIDHTVRRLSNGKSVLKTVVPFKRGDETLLLESFVDITDRVHTEKQLKKALEAADSASTAKSEFLSRMTHELRTPLNSIVGFSEILLTEEEAPLTGKVRSQVEHIAGAGQHLLQMITDVLDFSMIESGDFTISSKPVPASELIEESIKIVRQDADRAGVSIDVDFSISFLPKLVVDRSRFKQVLINLFSNGIKYNNKGGKLSLSGYVRGDKGFISISDTGIGVPEEKHADIFKPFSRFVEVDSGVEGAGVGLAISRQLIEAMGGDIDFTSKEGQGTTFILSVPVQPGSMEYPESESVQLPSVLYVDDDSSNIDELRNIVINWGRCTLTVRESIEKGMRALPLLKPDVVVISDALAGESLGEIIDDIRALESDDWVPFIAVSGNGGLQGADTVLPLPVELGGLQAIVMESKER